jgi:hypothetical protein
MFASVDGAAPGYMALTPHILARRHVSPPSTLGNDVVAYSKSLSDWPSSADALARMDGSFPECMANLPSTLR